MQTSSIYLFIYNYTKTGLHSLSMFMHSYTLRSETCYTSTQSNNIYLVFQYQVVKLVHSLDYNSKDGILCQIRISIQLLRL